MWQNFKTQIVTKVKNWNFEENQKFILWQNSKTQIVTKLKNWNFEKTKKKLKLWQNWKGHPPSADLRYGDEDTISPSTLISAARKGYLRIIHSLYSPWCTQENSPDKAQLGQFIKKYKETLNSPISRRAFYLTDPV